MSLAPYPRSRIYTTFNSYSSFLIDLIFGRIRKGDSVEKLERMLSKKLNVPYVVCMPMNRVGVYLVIKNLIKHGQGVIMSPYTIADVVNMVICAGGKPIFCDIERHSCNIDSNKIEQLIDDNVGAVLITHLHGIAAPAEEILSICQKHNLPLIEDTAQSFGDSENNKLLGTIGTAGIFSFGMYKNINCWYGGAVASCDKELIDKIRNEIYKYDYQSTSFLFKRILKGLVTDLLTLPIFFKPLIFWIFRYGYLNDIDWINRRVEIELDLKLKTDIPAHYLARFTPWQARLALLQLENMENYRRNRLAKAELYYKGLKDLVGLVLPPEKNKFSNSYMVFPIQYYDRKKLLKWLMSHNRDVAAQHLKNCADLSSFSVYYRDCPVARKTANEVIILPTYPKYPTSEVLKNIEVIRSFFSRDNQWQ